MTRRYYWDRYDRAAAVLRDLATVAQHLEEPPETLLLPKPGNSQGDILLVDDQPERLRWLSLALTEQGFTVRSAVDSRLALAALRSQPPDLLPKNVGLKPRPYASGTATPRGRLYAILKIEARVVNLSKNPVA
jgi:Response regulator containing CheY-like receiver, AAA-type ATPase, and DNA-binding domains